MIYNFQRINLKKIKKKKKERKSRKPFHEFSLCVKNMIWGGRVRRQVGE